MKKVIKIDVLKNFFTFIVVFLLISMAGCKNFMAGSDIKNSLDKEIDLAKAPIVSINIDGSHGKLSPAKGQYSVKKGVPTAVSYEADSDYFFIRWMILDNAGNEIENGKYLTIDNPKSSETSFTVTKVPEEELKVIPEIKERAQIISNSPIYDGSGVFRDSRIQIMFDHSMDEGSIYYTDQEIAELKENYKLSDEAFLIYNQDEENKKVYGYSYDGEIYFKNIEIYNYRTEKNMLENYGAPYFDSPTVLVIPAGYNPPLPGSQIVVNISGEVFYLHDDLHVTLSTAKKWNYMVNAYTDNINPTLVISTIKSANADGSLSENITAYDEEQSISVSDYKDYFVRDNKLYLAATMTDGGSGPESLYLQVSNITAGDGSSGCGDLVKKEIPLTIYGTDAFFGEYQGNELLPKEINLNDYCDEYEGLNRLTFIANDIKGNTTYKQYYYVYLDSVAPVFTLEPSVSLSASDNKQVDVQWGVPSDTDFAKVIVEYKEKDSDNVKKILSINEEDISYSLGDLENGKTYEIEVYALDVCGNKSQVYSFTKNTAPGKITFTEEQKPAATQDGTSVELKWTKPSGNYSGANIYYQAVAADTASSDRSVYKSSVKVEGDVSSTTINELSPGYKYNFILNAVDSEGNESYNSTVVSTVIKPNPVSNLKTSDITDSSLKLSWTHASSRKDGYIVSYREKDSEESWITQNLSASINSYVINELKSGTEYEFKVEPWAIKDSICGTAVSVAATTKAGAVNNFKSSVVSSDEITLEWKNPDSYDSLLLKYKASTASSYTQIPLAKGTTTYTLTGLTAGESYSILMYAIVNGEEGGYSTLTVDTVPYAVTGLTVDSASTSQVNLSWTAPASGVYSKTIIYYGTSQDSLTYSVEKNKGVTSASITGLTSGVKYYFSVKTESVGVSPKSSSSADITRVTTPSTASNIKSTESITSSTRTVTVSWDSVSGNYDSIAVYYGTTSSPSTYRSVTYGTNSVDITGLTAGTKYYFKVVTKLTIDGVSYNQESELKNFVNTPNNSTITSYTTLNTSEVKLTWSAPAGGKTGYKVYYKLSTASSYELYSSVTSGTTCTVSNLSAGRIYNFKVVTYLTVDGSTYLALNTTEYTRSTAPNPVTNLSVGYATSNNRTQAVVSWKNPTSGSYTNVKIYYKKSGDSTYISSVTPTNGNTSYTITGLTAGEQYNFKAVTTLTNSSIESSEQTSNLRLYANAVSSLTASEAQDSVILNWTKPVGTISGYNIYYKKSTDSSYTLKASAVSTSSTSYTVSSLESGTIYNFKVLAYSYSSSYGTEATVNRVTKCAAPTSISVYCDDGQGRIKLKWTNPSGNGFSKVEIKQGSTVKATVTGSAGGVSYTFIDVSSFSRSSSYSFSVVPYITQSDGTEVACTSGSLSYSNTSGNLKINGTTYSYTSLKNVITSATTISKNTKLTDGAFTSNRTITLSPYSIGTYEVTQQLYKAVTGSNPSTSNSGNYYPAENMNWYQALWFCNKLSEIMGLTPVYGINTSTTAYSSVPVDTTSSWSAVTYNMSANGYRLPTEAEWEFAARGGSTSASDWNYAYAGSDTRDTVAWSNTNAGGCTHTVGGKTSNRLGLYDMSGNVWEWITDWNNNVPSGTYTNPYVHYTNGTGSYNKSEDKVLQKGGSWKNDTDCKVDYNSTKETPGAEDNRTGFRIMRRKTCN